MNALNEFIKTSKDKMHRFSSKQKHPPFTQAIRITQNKHTYYYFREKLFRKATLQQNFLQCTFKVMSTYKDFSLQMENSAWNIRRIG